MASDLTPSQIDDLERLFAATGDEWMIYDANGCCLIGLRNDYKVVLEAVIHDDGAVKLLSKNPKVIPSIIALHNSFPALIATLRRLERENALLRDMGKSYGDMIHDLTDSNRRLRVLLHDSRRGNGLGPRWNDDPIAAAIDRIANNEALAQPEHPANQEKL